MNYKFLTLFLCLLFFGCAQNIALRGKIEDKESGLVFYHENYTRTNYVTPKGYDIISISFVILNNRNYDVLIDFDELYLIDNKNKLNRVEFVQGKRHDDDGKIYLTIKANIKMNKKVSFIIHENDSIKAIQYKDKQIQYKN